MPDNSYNIELMEFLKESPTPFHAVASMSRMLEKSGFTELREQDNWDLKAGQSYYAIRNGSALVAFKTGKGEPAADGVRVSGTHTDSPCLKVKPTPEISRHGYIQLGVEVYGGALLHPWFDRDLSLAGRVHYLSSTGEICSALIDFEAPIAVIPSLAIHLNREANDGYKINRQTELPPILLQQEDAFSFDEFLLNELQTNSKISDAAKVLSHELIFYDCQAPSLIGLKSDFLASARLDNLLSCFVACKSLSASNDDHASVLICNDHEEVGSVSSTGAQGPFLKSVLQRMFSSLGLASDSYDRAMSQSLMLSIDNAHGVHPNYEDKHDANHQPSLNAGPVIKLNANQRYASNSQSVAEFKSLCDSQEVPFQAFVVRSDMGCGSTIGPITSAELGIPTVDVGVATFAMHSIRELAGSKDPELLDKVVTAFYNR